MPHTHREVITVLQQASGLKKAGEKPKASNMLLWKDWERSEPPLLHKQLTQSSVTMLACFVELLQVSLAQSSAANHSFLTCGQTEDALLECPGWKANFFLLLYLFLNEIQYCKNKKKSRKEILMKAKQNHCQACAFKWLQPSLATPALRN